MSRSSVVESGDTRGAAAPGTILSLEGGVEVAVGDGSVLLTEVKPEGKRAMSAEEFVRGYRPEIGDRLGDGGEA